MHFDTIAALSDRFRRKDLTPVEVVDHLLKRIEIADKRYRSYVTVTEERARYRAKKAEAELLAGLWRGPLHGVPIALKDILYTDFAKTSAGSIIHRDFVPSFSATVSERLEMAGAIILGKLKTTEHAFARFHPSVVPPTNPWGDELWCGVSSSGPGVATAAGLAFGTIGSDTGGSIRFPAAANGITGLKPSWGRVSRYGVFPLAPSLDHIGPMTRSAIDAGIMFSVIAGYDENDPTSARERIPDVSILRHGRVAGLRVGLPHQYATDGVDGEVAAAWEATSRILSSLGARIRPIELRGWREACQHWGSICSAEAALVHKKMYLSRKELYGHSLGSFIEGGQKLSAVDAAAASLFRLRFSAEIAALFDEVDLILIPAISFRIGTWAEMKQVEREDVTEFLRFTAPMNITGNPCITVPVGFDSAGLPIAAQLVGRYLSEDVVLQAAVAFQQATDWHIRRPALMI